jgi:hypothetical protein
MKFPITGVNAKMHCKVLRKTVLVYWKLQRFTNTGQEQNTSMLNYIASVTMLLEVRLVSIR